MCFDRNINGNRDVKFLECDYLLLQRYVKLTLGNQHISSIHLHHLEIFSVASYG